MNLQELGALLRQERERRGVSLEQAASAVKISKKYLVALEEGRTDELPHPVYAKGFVKNYARLLELDPEECGEVLGRFYDVDDNHLRDAPRYEVKDSSPSIRERSAQVFKPSLWLGIPVVLAFCALVWFFFTSQAVKNFSLEPLTRIFTRSDSPAQPEPVKSEPAKPTSAKPEPVKSAPTRPEPAPAEPAKPQGADQASPVQRDLLALSPSGQARPQTEAAPSGDPLAQMAAESQFATKGNQVVEVNATAPAKVEVTDDSGQTRSFSLIKGQRLSLRFQNRLSVRFVQASAVVVKLNGKDYPLESGKIDGRTLQFP